MNFLRIYDINDNAFTIELSQEINEHTNKEVVALQEFIEQANLPGFVECVPAYSSLTIYVDGTSSINEIKQIVERKLSAFSLSENAARQSTKTTSPIIVPVCYDLEYGTDLTAVSNQLELSIDEIIELHTKEYYRVYMIGFVPGFPYMGTLPPELEMPRKKTPALKVPMGSVAIAGKQTGIYPAEVPGGWHIIGRTPLQLFDKSTEPYCLFKAGDLIQFKQISKKEFLDHA
jgi:inhibitor of KinA